MGPGVLRRPCTGAVKAGLTRSLKGAEMRSRLLGPRNAGSAGLETAPLPSEASHAI